MTANRPTALPAPATAGVEPSPGSDAVTLHCRDCPMWYGGEDEGWGPCSLKHQRGDERYLTHGRHLCDENYHPPPARLTGNAAAFNGVRSTSSASSVGYSSTVKAGNLNRRANRPRRSGASSTRRRRASTR